jgi:hypothetical protein
MDTELVDTGAQQYIHKIQLIKKSLQYVLQIIFTCCTFESTGVPEQWMVIEIK